MEGKPEAKIEGYPNEISYECSKKIIEQMEKNICHIIIIMKNKQTTTIKGTGFFSKLPFPTKEKMLPVLITNNHIINHEMMNLPDLKISIIIKEEEKIKTIILKNDDNRLKYSNKENDITIIEIKEKDNINNYLELDDIIIDDIINGINKSIEYIYQTIYIIQYSEGNLSVSYGIFGDIDELNKCQIKYKCSTKDGSSGSPILNIKNNKVIGIHHSRNDQFNYNNGTLLNIPIKDFMKNHLNKNNYKKNDSNKKYKIIKKKNDKKPVIKKKLNINLTKINKYNLKEKKIFVELIDLNLIDFKDLSKLFLNYNDISYIKSSNKIQFENIELENNKFLNFKSNKNYYIIQGKNRSYKLTETNIHDNNKLALSFDKPEIKFAYKITEKKKFLGNNEEIKKYMIEMCILLQIDHPNIIKTFEIISDSNNYYIIMEYNFEKKLLDIIVEQKYLTEEESAFYFYQIISGLEYLHSKNICHNNLNTQNILINSQHKLKISDFSMSNYCSKENNNFFKTYTNFYHYALPDLILERKNDEFKNDLWNAGIILYEMLCGYELFRAYKGDTLILKKIVNYDFDYPEHYINEDVKNLLKKILSKNRRERINIEEIKNDPFFKMGKNICLIYYNTHYKNNTQDIIIKQNTKDLYLNSNSLIINTERTNRMKRIKTEGELIQKNKNIRESYLSNSHSKKNTISKYKDVISNNYRNKFLKISKVHNINNDNSKIYNSTIINAFSNLKNNNIIKIDNSNIEKNNNFMNEQLFNNKVIYKSDKKNFVKKKQKLFQIYQKRIYVNKWLALDNNKLTANHRSSTNIKNNKNFKI